MKINITSITNKKCANPLCSNQIEIKIYSNPTHPNYGHPIVAHQRKITCCHDCHTAWQKSISWEDRIGTERATEIRKVRSELAKIDNPSTRPGGAEKVSAGMKRFLKENPEARQGENNPFYGRTHKLETIEYWKSSKAGKWSYNEEQKAKQTKNTPKKENHPNWNGGSSMGEYGPEFTRELKDYIKESYDHRCQICDTTDTDLDVHHIDYDKTNNSTKNLIPLCKVCHGKTNYNRDKWQKICEGKVDLKVKV